MPERKLTGKQQIAIDYYCGEAHQNWCKAYKMAGYSLCIGWKHNAIKLLHKDYIKDAIAKRMAKLAEKMQVTMEEVVDNARWLVEYGRKNNTIGAVSAGNDQLGRTIAAFTDNVNQTDTQKQRVLDEREAREAERIASIANRERIAEQHKQVG